MRVLTLAITSISALLHRIHLYDGASGLQFAATGGDEGPSLTTCDVESAPSLRLLGSWSHRGRDTTDAKSRHPGTCTRPRERLQLQSRPPPGGAGGHGWSSRLRRDNDGGAKIKRRRAVVTAARQVTDGERSSACGVIFMMAAKPMSVALPPPCASGMI